jgi:hypothetical protein
MRQAAFMAYLTTPHEEGTTFGAYLESCGLGDDSGSEVATEDELNEAREVAAEADALAAAGAFRRYKGVQAMKAAAVLG